MPTDPSNAFSMMTDAFQQATQINARLLERAAQHQMELLNASVEAGSRGTQLMHNPEALREITSRYTERVLETLRRSMEAFTKAQQELIALQTGFQRSASDAFTKGTASPSKKK
jgi:hypothetical protein